MCQCSNFQTSNVCQPQALRSRSCPKLQEQCNQALRVRAHSQSLGYASKIPVPSELSTVLCQSRGVREIISASRQPHGNVLLPRRRAMGAAEAFWGRHGVRHRGQGSWTWSGVHIAVPGKFLLTEI